MTDLDGQFCADARLVILAELARHVDATVNSRTLCRLIDSMGVRRPVEWVETQLHFLAALGAIRTRAIVLPGVGGVIVATLAQVGRDHVEGRSMLSGVSRPMDGN